MTSTLYISKEALEKNLKFVQRTVGKTKKVSLVVKGNAYGHGIKEYVPLAESLGMDHFSVFSDVEAKEVKKHCQKNTQVMIMGMIEKRNMKWVIENDIDFFVFDLDRLKQALKVSQQIKKKARIHLELETGMNRTGLDEQDLEHVVEILKKHKRHFRIEGVCTHYAGAESISNYYRIHKQIKKFQKLDRWLRTQGIEPKIRHTACSAASVNYPKTRMDLVRVGIMQYGFWPSEETFISYIHQRKQKRNPLTPILSWKSKIMSVKDVPAGQFVGYGDSFLANEDTKIAIVPVGYTNGYGRILSNQSSILVHGKRVNVIGAVNMNLLIINISQIPEVKKGDEVVLVGTQKDMTISFSSFREQYNSLNYEILARLPGNIPRKIIS